MLDRFAWLVEGLVVREERMRENVASSFGLYFSQRLLLALVESGLTRDDAYRLVQRNAMRAWDEQIDFRSLVEQTPRSPAGSTSTRCSTRAPTPPTSTSSSIACGRSSATRREGAHV